MFNFQSANCDRRCDGVSRRTFLRVGSLPLFGLSLPKLLQASDKAAPPPRAKNCILLWLDGGISTIDTFDMKPNAPDDYRGEFKPISTNLPGVTVCEHLPRVAQMMDRICQLRTVVHSGSQHAEACHQMLTGWPQIPGKPVPAGATVHPCYGSVVSEQLGWRGGLPPAVQLCGGIKYHNAGFLGSAYDPLQIEGDLSAEDFQVKYLSLPESMRGGRLQRRRSMLQAVDDLQRIQDRAAGPVFDRNQFYGQAYDLITSPKAKEAFRIDKENEKLRDRYGRFEEGQATLLARRLVESGVRFVTVQFNGYDTHDKNFIELRRDLLPKLDQAYSALLSDLAESGLLEETLVICMGEFGRTPKVNGAAGRDHYPKVNNLCFSGAGVRMGETIGQTDERCANVVSSTNTSHDVAATIYDSLGVEHSKEYQTSDNRPILTTDHGKPIREILA